jgi:hypothetical protein
MEKNRGLRRGAERRFAVRLAVFALCAATAGPLLAAGRELSGPDIALIQRLLEAKAVRPLDELFPPAPSTHPAVKAVYRWKRLKLAPGDAEELRYLQGLPASRDDLWSVYALTYIDAFEGNTDITNVVYGLFERAASLAHKHHQAYRRVFELCLESDGELAEAAWKSCGWLLQHAPAPSLAVFRGLPPADQKRICPDTDVRRLTPAEAAKRCLADERAKPAKSPDGP